MKQSKNFFVECKFGLYSEQVYKQEVRQRLVGGGGPPARVCAAERRYERR